MEQISKLLQQLADKLGTTVTYLWHVLINQAYVNGIGNLIIYLIVAIAGIILYRIHKHLMKDDSNFNYSENEGLMPPMIIGFIAWLVLVIVCIFSINDTINSFLNPEYWALHQILNKV